MANKRNESVNGYEYYRLRRKVGVKWDAEKYVVDGEFVKVAVRVSMSNKYFIRSLYVLNKNRVNNFINKGTLKKV